MKPACRTIGRERQRLEDIAPNNPISEECWISVSLPPPAHIITTFSATPTGFQRSVVLRPFAYYLRTSAGRLVVSRSLFSLEFSKAPDSAGLVRSSRVESFRRLARPVIRPSSRSSRPSEAKRTPTDPQRSFLTQSGSLAAFPDRPLCRCPRHRGKISVALMRRSFARGDYAGVGGIGFPHAPGVILPGGEVSFDAAVTRRSPLIHT